MTALGADRPPKHSKRSVVSHKGSVKVYKLNNLAFLHVFVTDIITNFYEIRKNIHKAITVQKFHTLKCILVFIRRATGDAKIPKSLKRQGDVQVKR